MGVKVTETTLRKGGESSRSLSERTGTRTFLVQYDATTPPANLAAVETASGGGLSIPALEDAFPGDSTRTCKKVTAKTSGDGTKLLYEVTCEYDDQLDPYETTE